MLPPSRGSSEGKLGGHLPLASMIKGTYLDNVELALKYLVNTVNALPIRVKTNTVVDIDLIRAESPDAVIVACGGLYRIEAIDGANKANCTDVNMLQSQAKLPLKVFGSSFVDFVTRLITPGIGKKVVVIGSGVAGLQGALWFKKRKKQLLLFPMMGK